MKKLPHCDFVKSRQAVLDSCFCAFLVCFFALFLPSCTIKSCESDIRLAEQLLWQDLDSCQIVLDKTSSAKLSEQWQQRRTLCAIHLNMRLGYAMDSTINLYDLGCYFSQHEDYLHAAEAFYVAGTYSSIENKCDQATSYLKMAEYDLSFTSENSAQLKGIIYYRLGEVAEQERVFTLANDYYRKAIPYLAESDNNLYLACAYRNVAASCQEDNEQEYLLMLDSALTYANKCGDELTRSTILLMKTEKQCADRPDIFMPMYQYICDTLGYLTYASVLVDYYMQLGNLSQAEYYLAVLAFDTINNIWSKEHFQYQLAEYLKAIGEKDSAIQVLQQLHLSQTREIETHAYTRTYNISQYYDLAHEQEYSMKLQMDKQRLYLVLLAVLLLWVLLVSGWYIYRQRARSMIADQQLAMAKQSQKIAEQSKQVAVLQAKNSEKQKALAGQLRLRIRMTEHIQSYRTQKEEIKQIPDWVQKVIDSLIFSSNIQAKQLCDDIDSVYDNVLTRLRNEYPALTEADILVCGLIITGLDMSEICLLADMTKRTFYKRRERIRQHLNQSISDSTGGAEPIADIDDIYIWLRDFAAE